jgi:sulfite reductase (NADPH) flavoprotein alpha-component
MIRSLHRWPGLIAALLLCVIAVSGTALSLFPALESASSPAAPAISVAELAARVQAAEPTVEQIRQAPSGRITAYYYEGDQPAAAVIDPSTGAAIGSADTSALQRWLTNLHRSLFLDDAGRIVAAIGAAAMLAMSISGLALLARRAGGWRHIFASPRGRGDGRLHASIARFSVAGLMLSSLTALWMTASTFGFVPEGAGAPAFPADVSGRTGLAPASIELLQQTPIADLRKLTFPVAGDKNDVFTLKTTAGEGYLDQGTGALLAWSDAGAWASVSEFIIMLHTGQGASVLGLLLGLSALAVPVMSWSGIRLWLRGRKDRKSASVPADEADTIVLVGSEGGTTWGFAETLRAALTSAGEKVHVGPMSAFEPARWPRAKRIVLLAATYGDGEAPSSAHGFLQRLAALPSAPEAPLAVLGFGDRSFPAFCSYAAEIVGAAEAKGWRQLLPMDTVDRQSPQDFARWGRDLAQALGLAFELNHQAVAPKTLELRLLSRRDYGADVQATTAILRFALPKVSFWQRLAGQGFPRFEAGDLVGILPEGSYLPRLYSLGVGKPRRFPRDLRAAASGRSLLQPAHHAGAGGQRARVPAPQSGLPAAARQGPRAADRRRYGYRSACRLCPRQPIPAPDAPLFRCTPSLQRCALFGRTDGLAAGWALGFGHPCLFPRVAADLRTGRPAQGRFSRGEAGDGRCPGHGLRRSRDGGRRRQCAERHPGASGADPCNTESGGTLCGRRLLTFIATR